jgi:FMN phosphatase YigB (HAD superfamily)
MSEIKNIIFDLGGVIINLDIPRTIAEFNKLTDKPFETIYTQLQQTPLFDNFDKGLITEEKFFEEINLLLQAPVSNEQLTAAWNAMLLDFPLHRLELLSSLKTSYRLFLLSNTNETHITEFEKQLHLSHGHKNMEPFFEKVYYSCRMHMRKPDAEIFEFVLKENNLKPEETLFIDDSPQHIEGALKTGIRAHFLTKGREFEALLKELHVID